MRSFIRAAGLAAILFGTARALEAQALGPQRQLLSLEPYYTRLELDAGSGQSRVGLNGYGALLWLNFAPFSGPSQNVIGKTGLALFGAYTPNQNGGGFTTLHYGGELDVHFVNYPIAGVLDPFISLGAGAFRTKMAGGDAEQLGSTTKFDLEPGFGIRVPIANRFQLRADAKDLIIFSALNADGSKRTANNLELRGGLGLTF